MLVLFIFQLPAITTFLDISNSLFSIIKFSKIFSTICNNSTIYRFFQIFLAIFIKNYLHFNFFLPFCLLTLDFSFCCGILRGVVVIVAQLVRAPGCGPGGRGFESPLSPHFFVDQPLRKLGLFLCFFVKLKSFYL